MDTFYMEFTIICVTYNEAENNFKHTCLMDRQTRCLYLSTFSLTLQSMTMIHLVNFTLTDTSTVMRNEYVVYQYVESTNISNTAMSVFQLFTNLL